MNIDELMKTTHMVKILPEYFNDVAHKVKTFELRKDDRNYKPGDDLILREYDGEHFTGRKIYASIKYVLRDCVQYGLLPGYCILAIKVDEVII